MKTIKIFVLMCLAVLLMPIVFSDELDLMPADNPSVDSTTHYGYHVLIQNLPPDLNQGDVITITVIVYYGPDEGYVDIVPNQSVMLTLVKESYGVDYVGEVITDYRGMAQINYQIKSPPGIWYRFKGVTDTSSLPNPEGFVVGYGNYFTIHERPPIIGSDIRSILPKVICPNTNPTINSRYCPKESQ